SWCEAAKPLVRNWGFGDCWFDRDLKIPAGWKKTIANRTSNIDRPATRWKWPSMRSLALYSKLQLPAADNLWMDQSVAHAGVQAKKRLRGNLLPLLWNAGARSGWAEEDRKCPFCDAEEVETVEHMVSSCSFYDALRQRCRDDIAQWVEADNPHAF